MKNIFERERERRIAVVLYTIANITLQFYIYLCGGNEQVRVFVFVRSAQVCCLFFFIYAIRSDVEFRTRMRRVVANVGLKM